VPNRARPSVFGASLGSRRAPAALAFFPFCFARNGGRKECRFCLQNDAVEASRHSLSVSAARRRLSGSTSRRNISTQQKERSVKLRSFSIKCFVNMLLKFSKRFSCFYLMPN